MKSYHHRILEEEKKGLILDSFIPWFLSFVVFITFPSVWNGEWIFFLFASMAWIFFIFSNFCSPSQRRLLLLLAFYSLHFNSWWLNYRNNKRKQNIDFHCEEKGFHYLFVCLVLMDVCDIFHCLLIISVLTCLSFWRFFRFCVFFIF